MQLDKTSILPKMLSLSSFSPADTPAVTASGCPDGSCSANGTGLVYALGQLQYDFVSEARRDWFLQHGLGNPDDPKQVLTYLAQHPSRSTALTWVLAQETMPIYAIVAMGPFAIEIYETLREFLDDQLNEGIERISIPGWLHGSATLANGQRVPVVMPELRGHV